MKFGDMPVSEAVGAILAHSHRVDGGALRKGRTLTADDAGKLSKAGVAIVRVARLEDGDLDEQEAAQRIATALAGNSGITPGTPGTGRVNLFAETHGLLLVDTTRLIALNAVDEAVTASTFPPFRAVSPGQIIATVKIIPFGVAETTVAQCETLARSIASAETSSTETSSAETSSTETSSTETSSAETSSTETSSTETSSAETSSTGTSPGGDIITVAPFIASRITLIQTTLPHTQAALLEKGRTVTNARLRALGVGPAEGQKCTHDAGAIAKELEKARAEGCDIALVLGASAITDRRDIVPEAVSAAGGSITRLGLPVDPGNLTLLAKLGEMHILGVPGSARSPREHGFDWVLQRLMAGIPPADEDFPAMAIGGLLKDIPGRPTPRRQASRMPTAAKTHRQIAAVVLAAGQSRRMGGSNKLLHEFDGEAIVVRTADTALSTQADPVVVVLGHEADRVRTALAGRHLAFVENPDYASGMSTSLACGLNALPESVEGAVICLGDMPLVGAGEIDRLIAGFDPDGGRMIGVPTYRGKRGNPVLIARRLFPEALAIAGDIGARHLLGTNPDWVYEVAVESHGVLTDADTPEALKALVGAAAQDPAASATDSDPK